MASQKTYVYCNVLPADYSTSYSYICDFDVKPGDFVVIAIRTDTNLKVGLVVDVGEFTESNTPFPPQRTRHILRLFGDNESEFMEKQKQLLLSISDQLQNEIQLSDDGKTVTGFDFKFDLRRTVIHIPSGVESIDDLAFFGVRVNELYLPKELKQLGTYTLLYPSGTNDYSAKYIDKIEVEEGNKFFCVDEGGFYSMNNGQRRLERLLDKKCTVYRAPSDVTSYSPGCFSHCPALRKVILADDTEEFSELIITDNTNIEEIYISKHVKKLTLKRLINTEPDQKLIRFLIDEENETYFTDEDSIYEVLADGTYRLLMNRYTGKGKPLILEGTSAIGRNAFRCHSNIKKIEFPKTLRVIEGSAFEKTELKTLVVPDHVQHIGSKAFCNCEYLKSVTLPSGLEAISEDAFYNCPNVNKIKTNDRRIAFEFKNGIVTRLVTQKKYVGSDEEEFDTST